MAQAAGEDSEPLGSAGAPGHREPHSGSHATSPEQRSSAKQAAPGSPGSCADEDGARTLMEIGKLLKQQTAGRQLPHAHVSQSSGSTAVQLGHSQRAALLRPDGLGDAGHASEAGQHEPPRRQVLITPPCLTLA